MRKTNILLMVITVCVICMIGLAWKCWLQSKTLGLYDQILLQDKNYIEVSDEIRDFKHNEILAFQSVGFNIPETSITDNSNTSRIYLRLHQGICASCYVNSIIDINTALSESNPILIVGSYEYQSTYDDLLRDCRLTDADHINDLSIFNRIPADLAGTPYIFTLDAHGSINNILFLDKSKMDQERINAYIDMINRYTKQKQQME